VVLALLVAMEGRLTAGAPSRSEGLVAWHRMYSVLAHPRCINCPTAANSPEQAMTDIPTCPNDAIIPFTLAVPQADLEDLKRTEKNHD
jgi:hypothetical protein